MPTTNFIANTTVVPADWLNEVDAIVFDVFGGASSKAAAKAAISVPGLADSNTFTASNEFPCGGFVLNDSGKYITFDATPHTATGMELSLPVTSDSTGTLVLTSVAQTLTNKTITIDDDKFTLKDAGTTKQAQFQCSGITSGTTRILTLQDADLIVAGTNVNQTFSKAQRASITVDAYAANLSFDFGASNNFEATLTGNITFANPTNVVAGQSGIIRVKQDAVGSRTASFGSNWKFAGGAAPTLTTTPSATDILAYYVLSATEIAASIIKDVK